MANNIKISSATDNMAKIKVRSTNVSIPVQATSVEASHYADIAEDYAGRAQESASIAKEAEQNAIIAVENISTLTSDSLNRISNATTEALSDIDDASAPVFEHLDTVKVVSDNISNVLYVANNVDTILNKTLEIGTVTTTEAGTNATIVNSGTQYNPVLDFTIPKGDQGVKGDDGGMDATYDEETKTLSFYNETGTVLRPQWGNLSGDISLQVDLQNALEQKQQKGDYVLKSDIPTNISAFNNDVAYVTDTDYANSSKGGVVKVNSTFGVRLTSGGNLQAVSFTSDAYSTAQDISFVGKGTLENIKDDYIKRGVTENQIELSEDEKANAKAWLGYAELTDIMQAIASIPQFKLSIVESLPVTGEKMTLYLVPKEGTNNDVYDEYIWIEQTSSFEHLGTTAVDLTDYVKKTDYATTSSAGVLKVGAGIGVLSSTGQMYCNVYSLQNYNNFNVGYFISKGTLENIKDDYVKRGLTENSIGLTEEEQANAQNWLGITDVLGNIESILDEINGDV